MELNLTVLTSRNNLVFCLGHVTIVVTVETHLLVILKYKMTNRCVYLRNYTASCV